MSEQAACNCPRIDGYVIRSQGCTHPVHRPKPAVSAAPITEPYADVDVDLVCAWSDYRKDYGVPSALAICADPGEWAYDNGWPRKMVEDAHGPLTPIRLPGYPHDDVKCRQDSVDAASFPGLCRVIARISEAAGLPQGLDVEDIADAVVKRLTEPPQPPRGW